MFAWDNLFPSTQQVLDLSTPKESMPDDRFGKFTLELTS